MKNGMTESSWGNWLDNQKQKAAEAGSLEGLFGPQGQYKEVVLPTVRAKARDLYGEPTADPVSLRERRAGMAQRREKISASLSATPLSRQLAEIFGSDLTKPLTSWRAGSIISILFGLWGLLHHERTWGTWGILLLGAVLSVLVFQIVPVLFWVVVEMLLVAGVFLRNTARLIAIERRLGRLEEILMREEDLRHRSEQWISETTALLLAEYDLNKNIAMRVHAAA
jgi:hypothetical protein